MEAPSQPGTRETEAKPAAQGAPLRLAQRLYRQPVALVAVVAVLLLAWQWYDSHRQINALQHELAQRLAEADVQNKESRNVAEQVREAMREAQVKLGVLESKLQESQNQQIALEALYQELSRSRDESLLADVEQTLLVANQQLQVAGNVKSALIALQTADARLARARPAAARGAAQGDRARHRAAQARAIRGRDRHQRASRQSDQRHRQPAAGDGSAPARDGARK